MESSIITGLDQLRDQGILADIDIAFAQLIGTLNPKADESVLLAAALTSYVTCQGHSCFELTQYAGRIFPPSSEELSEVHIRCPELHTWLQALTQCDRVGQPGHYVPLILEKTRLYLFRYWDYEQRLTQCIQYRLHTHCVDLNLTLLAQGLVELFPQSNEHSPSDQRLAAEIAVKRNFCIISGGPGTGKTTTVIKILILLLEQNPNYRIVLAAPTGKAAARLKQAIRLAKAQLAYSPVMTAAIPEEAYTLHRLLRPLNHTPYFQHNAANPLPYDIVIVDEASMIDLPLMTKLAEAIAPQARWLLLGDKDQLASVEVGSVLNDIYEAAVDGASPSHLRESLVLLKHSYRFTAHSGIGQLAEAVKTGDSDRAWQLLHDPSLTDIHWRTVTKEDLGTVLHAEILPALQPYLHTTHPTDALHRLEEIRILCALRHGLFGAVTINQWIERLLRKVQWINHTSYRWYHRQPVMVTRNDYALRLFNGDVGVVFWHPQYPRELHTFFPHAESEIRAIAPNRLPEHETVYAMTIHKSQGSEFDRVILLLPEQFSTLLTRELLYTGITRARQRVDIWGTESVFKQTIISRIQRTSGLTEALTRIP